MIENDPEYIEWREQMVACKQAIMRSSNMINPKDLDARLDEFLAAPVLAEMMRRKVMVIEGTEPDSIDVVMPTDIPEQSKNMINAKGTKLASIFLGSAPSYHKDQMVELGAMIMICCQLMMSRICTSITTEDDRLIMATASAELIQDTLISMLKALGEAQAGSLTTTSVS